MLELQRVKNSWYKLALLTVIPLGSFGLIVTIFSSGVVHNLPICVVDQEHSSLSRTLLFHLESSPTLHVAYRCDDVTSAIKLLQDAKVYGVIIIPHNFTSTIMKHQNPQVVAMLNTQYLLVGKILKAAILESVMGSAAEVEFVQNLSHTPALQEAKAQLMPISLEVYPLFNKEKNYFIFLVSAILPAMWQIFLVMSVVVSFGSLFKRKDEHRFYNKEHLFSQIFGQLFVYTLAYVLMGVAILFYLYGVRGWEFHGSMAVMEEALFVTTLAYEAMALTFFVLSFDYARALSLGAVYTAPAFAFLGITFPADSMNSFALFWRDMLPISHYMQVQIDQANYALGVGESLQELSSVLFLTLFFIPVLWRFKQRLGV
jgi:ABC-2 type transport system permease protein